MKLNKKILMQACLAVGFSLTTVSCDDFLDREPLSAVTPQEYFQTVDHFAAYAISHYTGLFSTHGGFGMGIGNGDNNTDNAITGMASTGYFVKDNWKVPGESNGWNFGTIRSINYFFEEAVPKFEKGLVSGSETDIKHYIGEMHFLRGWSYFQYLMQFGDYPIITEVLPDDAAVLIEKGKRQPRNEVARFILKELDAAIEMLHSQGFDSNNRINKETALLVKSRVALYEASFERYHKGTGRVPGDEQWPGKKVHPDFTLDVEAEVNFFLEQALDAAAQVADKTMLTENNGLVDENIEAGQLMTGNPYFDMYASVDLSQNQEVLFWRSYSKNANFAITHGVPAWTRSGGDNGLLKTYMESFLMKDGRPWYAASTANPYEGDETLDKVKANRDGRLQLFVFSEKNILPRKETEGPEVKAHFIPHPAAGRSEMRDRTCYRLRKYASFDPQQNVWGKAESTTGCIIFRAVEAYLNYIEAYYMRYNKLDGKADKYWRAVRNRAKVDENYQTTIDLTDLSKETDWAKYSGETSVDKTLFNIRRERRCEFIGENMRWNDLIRWRSFDQLLTNKFIPEGCNFWTEIYKYANRDENGTVIKLIDDGGAKANVSSKSLGKYFRPMSINKNNNQLYDGYSWAKANYLSPVPVRQIELLSPDGSIENSVIYQNPYWSTKIGDAALE